VELCPIPCFDKYSLENIHLILSGISTNLYQLKSIIISRNCDN
jgi:hypothetical protein